MTTKNGNPKDLAADNKVPLWLLSPIAKAKWALAQFCGLVKYGAWNWRVKGVRYSVYLSAMERHLDAIKSGETFDPVDGTDHRGNIMACAAILLDAEAAGKLTDDRAPRVDMRPTYEECELNAAALRSKYEDRNPRHYTIADTYDDESCPETEPSWKGRTAVPIEPPFVIEDSDLEEDADGYMVERFTNNIVWR